jgi:hypothetical protein
MNASLITLSLLLGASLALAQSVAVPMLLSYQGRATDAAGVLIGNTAAVNRTITFKIYNLSTGGSAVYAEAQTATISGGEFSVLIGNGVGLAGSPGPSAPATTLTNLSKVINETTGNIYLGVTVDDGTSAADTEISPRQQLVSGAYSLRAKTAESVVNGSITAAMIGAGQVQTNQIVTNAINSEKIIDGAVTTSDLAGTSVTSDKLAGNSVSSAKIADGTIATADIAANAITIEKLDAGNIGVWKPTGTSVYRSSGNVGIGTTAPAFPLSFSDAAGDKISLAGASGNTYGFGVGASLLQIHSDTVNSNIAFGYGSSAAMTETMRITGTGKVGIGVNAPTATLQVKAAASNNDPSANGLYVYNPNNTTGNHAVVAARVAGASGGNPYLSFDVAGVMGWSIGIDNADGDKLKFMNDWAFNSTTVAKMTVQTDGKVGIGTTTPLAPLHVAGGAVNSFLLEYFMDAASVTNTSQTKTDLSHSIIADQRVRATAFDVNSEERIKNKVVVSDGVSDLAVLQAIEVTDYFFKDVYSMGDKPQKRVIAQQVETVFPMAVNQSSGVVPDIFQKAMVDDGWVQLATHLKVGEQVRLLGDDVDTIFEVLEVRNDSFRTDFLPTNPAIFVYGRSVTDFRSVDYDAIAMLNVSATQQIKKEKDAEVKALRLKNAELEARLATLEKLISAGK